MQDIPSAQAVQAALDALAKPPGSLGRLEALAKRLCHVQKTLAPKVRPHRLVLFAADHGVATQGVTAWPQSVTTAMLQTIMAGTSVSAVFARLFQVDLRVVDVGSRTPPAVEPDVHFRSARVTAGSADLSSGPALTLEQFEKAWQIGQQEVLAAHAEGFAVLALGEMGIGNTTPAACLTSYITGVDPHLATGRGAGADDATLARKHMIVKSAVAQAHQLCSTTNQQTALAALSGYEIAAMAGFIAGAAQQGSAVVLDGYVTTAAALVAEVLQPGCTEILIAAHRSAEPGHKAALDYLNLVPLLEWDMRLGEGSGALLALPMIEAAAALLTQVASLPQGAQA